MIKDKIMTSRTLSRTLILAFICIIVFTNQQCKRGDRLQPDKSTYHQLYRQFFQLCLTTAALIYYQILAILDLSACSVHKNRVHFGYFYLPVNV